MSLYTDWVNENCDPDDYEEPENRCSCCYAFISKRPTVTKQVVGVVTVETVEIVCKRCGRAALCERWALTEWGSVEVDYLRDPVDGSWINDAAEIERIVKVHNPHRWNKPVSTPTL
jgi:hypothetical protein